MTGSVSNKEEAGLANIVVKLLVEGRSVNARHIGVIVITPYDAQTNFIRDLLTRDASLNVVEVANIQYRCFSGSRERCYCGVACAVQLRWLSLFCR